MSSIGRDDVVVVLILVLVFVSCVYLLLGSFGLLPQYFYDKCDNVSLNDAIKSGCCEDRSKGHPVSWFFGESNCDRYRGKRNE